MVDNDLAQKKQKMHTQLSWSTIPQTEGISEAGEFACKFYLSTSHQVLLNFWETISLDTMIVKVKIIRISSATAQYKIFPIT